MEGGDAEGDKVDAGGNATAAMVGTGTVARGVVAGGVWSTDLEIKGK